MIKLAIDTTRELCSLSLFNNNKIYDFVIAKEPLSHAKNIFPLLDKLFKNNNINYLNLNDIYIIVGPGSFTGIRVGMTLVKMLGLTTNCNLHGISNMQLIAITNNFSSKQTINVIMSARGDLLYLQSFSHQMVELTEIKLIDKKNINFDIKNTKIIAENTLKDILFNKNIFYVDINALTIGQYINQIIKYEISKPIKPLYIKEASIN